MEPRRLLLVSADPADEDAARKALDALEQPAVELAVARDGLAALELLLAKRDAARATRLPDVVLLGVVPPGAAPAGPTSADVLASLRSDPRTRRLPVVVLGAADDPRGREESLALGANGWM